MKWISEEFFAAWCAERKARWSMVQETLAPVSLWVLGSTETETIDIEVEGSTPAEARYRLLAAYAKIRGGASVR